MNQPTATEAVRPTKKQKLLLDYIGSFIAEHGYSPSFREIKNALNYNSVATVALHINSLVARGHLLKREHSARSLEVVDNPLPANTLKTNQITEAQEKWLVDKVEYYFAAAESGTPDEKDLDRLYVLIGALRVLELEGAAQSFISRLSDIKKRLKS
jgi:SOS-response transcriptional repressor LexA